MRLRAMCAARFCDSSEALHPMRRVTVNKPLGLFPKHGGFSYRSDFGEEVQQQNPFRAALRSCSESRSRLLMVFAPLARNTQS